MKKITCFIALFCVLDRVHASIGIGIVSPSLNQITDSVLNIKANVTSTYDVGSVIASVGGNQATLTYNSAENSFTGILSLTGVKKGDTLTLSVTVKDVFNNEKSASVNFIYAPPPTLNIIYPIDYSNSYPTIHVKAVAVATTGKCQLEVFIYGYGSLFFYDAVDTVISMPYGSNAGSMEFHASDRWGQQTSGSRNLFYENNPYLTEVYAAPGKIFDFNYNKLLTINATKGQIVDLSNQTVTDIKNSYLDNESYQFPYSFLTPYGAIFYQVLNNDIYEWDNDSLYKIGPDQGYLMSNALHTAGKYATWGTQFDADSSKLFLRNLETHTDEFIAAGDKSSYNDVASNGVVVYLDQTPNVIWYHDGISTPVSSESNDSRHFNLVTDGNYVVYTKRKSCCDYYTYMSDGTAETELAYAGNYNDVQPVPTLAYQVNNKYIAYTKLGNLIQKQIWLRDPAGTTTQATFFGNNSELEKLNPNGDIMYIRNDGLPKRYLTTKGNLLPTELGTVRYGGKVYYSDSSWYIVMGRHLYRVNVNAQITSASGNWTDASSWKNNVLPAANADVIIQNNIIVNDNITCNSLKVVPPGSIIVLPGYNLTVLH